MAKFIEVKEQIPASYPKDQYMALYALLNLCGDTFAPIARQQCRSGNKFYSSYFDQILSVSNTSKLCEDAKKVIQDSLSENLPMMERILSRLSEIKLNLPYSDIPYTDGEG